MEKDGTTERSQRIEALIDGILAQVRTVPAEVLQRRSQEGEWMAMELLAHVAELLPYWARQAREVSERAGDGELFGRSTVNPEEDPDRLAAITGHGGDQLTTIEALLQAGLTLALADLRAIHHDRWGRNGRQANGQITTVAQIVDQRLIAHLQSHAEQLARILQQQ